MPRAVRPDGTLAATRMDTPIPVHDIVVSYPRKSPRTMPPVYLCDCEVTPLRCRSAVQYYFFYLSLTFSRFYAFAGAGALTIAARHFVDDSGRQMPYCSKFTRLR